MIEPKLSMNDQWMVRILNGYQESKLVTFVGLNFITKDSMGKSIKAFSKKLQENYLPVYKYENQISDTYRIRSVLKVEKDIITSIRVSLIGQNLQNPCYFYRY